MVINRPVKIFLLNQAWRHYEIITRGDRTHTKID